MPNEHDTSDEVREAGATSGGRAVGSSRDRLIAFARFPEAGKTKTRLIPALGADRAARLQEALTRRTLAVAWSLHETHPFFLEVRFAGGDAERMVQLYGPADAYLPQHGDDLGHRLEQATAHAFEQGVDRLIVIGTDSPDLSAAQLAQAFRALDSSDVVVGPAEDGGYYLIGMKRHYPTLFRGIDWSTERVFEQTVASARLLGCRLRFLSRLPDVDRPEDLITCRRYPEDFRNVLPQSCPDMISVIVPALNEERRIAVTLRQLNGRDRVEVIVADGGSTDATVQIAREMGAAIVSARSGRGPQMNAGAALASGDILLFLHADTQLPANFPDVAKSVLQQNCVAGAFRLCVDSPDWRLRWIERAANWRSRFLQAPYGDQALFLRAELFYEMGGFRNWPLMEDYEFCRRLRGRGRIHLADESVKTSARRWEKLGVCRTTLWNQLTILGYHMGMSPKHLADWYTPRSGPSSPSQ